MASCGDSQLSEEARFLLNAVQSSGSVAAAPKFFVLLKKWAKEGRPYKGRIFSIADVEAAMKAFMVQHKSSGTPQVLNRAYSETASRQESSEATERQVTLQARSPWPTKELADAAAKMVADLNAVAGMRGSSAVSNGRLLKSFYDHAEKPLPEGGGDVSIEACGEAPLRAHSAALAAVSHVLACKFDGRFGAAGGNVNARDFRPEIVRIALQFVYGGSCMASEHDLGELFALADFWALQILKDAVFDHVSAMRPIPALASLATFDVKAISPPELGEKIAARAADAFQLAAGKLTRAPREPMPQQAALGKNFKKAEEEWAQKMMLDRSLWSTKVAPVWQFARELKDAISSWSPEDCTRVRSMWIESEGSVLGKALEEFFRKTLLTGAREQVELIMNLRELLLPHSLSLKVARCLVDDPGFVDETGQLHAWMDWVMDKRLSFQKQWVFYCTIRNAHSQKAARMLGATEDPTTAGLPEAPADSAPSASRLPEIVEKTFAMAFSVSLSCGESANRWAGLLEHNAGTSEALDESVRLVAHFITRSRGALGNLTPKGVLRVLEYAIRDLPTAAVSLKGPDFLKDILGVYTTGDAPSSGSFRRMNTAESLRSLVLRRVQRAASGIDFSTESSTLAMDWTGVPSNVLRAARFEWKIQRAEDSMDDVPLAVALDPAKDPTQICSPWYIYVAKTRKFHECSALRVSNEVFSQDGASPVCAALVTWAHSRAAFQKCTSLSLIRELCQLVKAEGGPGSQATANLCELAAKDKRFLEESAPAAIPADPQLTSSETEQAENPPGSLPDAPQEGGSGASNLIVSQSENIAEQSARSTSAADKRAEVGCQADLVPSPARACPPQAALPQSDCLHDLRAKQRMEAAAAAERRLMKEVPREPSLSSTSTTAAPTLGLSSSIPATGVTSQPETPQRMDVDAIAGNGLSLPSLPNIKEDINSLLDSFELPHEDAGAIPEPPIKARRIDNIDQPAQASVEPPPAPLRAKQNAPVPDRLNGKAAPPAAATTDSQGREGCCMDADVNRWDVAMVCGFLDTLELGALQDAFRENAVDGQMLKTLSEDDLVTELGLKKLQARKVLQRLPKQAPS